MDYSLGFAVTPGTVLFSKARIRTLSLNHHEEKYSLSRNTAIPTSEGKLQLLKTVSGNAQLAGGETVPFTITHNADVRIIPVDDSTTANGGAEFQEIDLALPSGHAVVRIESVYNGKQTGWVSNTYVNGALTPNGHIVH